MDITVTAALITLATTGDPSALQQKLGGEIRENLPTSRAVLNQGEMYAPPALTVKGTTYRMVAPTVTTDNFVIETGDLIVRFDTGVSEGDRVLRVVAAARTNP
ncbi:MAG: hypothetical protein OXB87_05055 [Hyphomicrobiales bacterium]|nr:hypothetical protein [Hyphomicrobiales bacterium]